MSIWSRIKAKRQAPPEIQVCSPLSRLECHNKLTGRDNPRWLGYPFLKMLRLHGTMSVTAINVRLKAFHVSGSVEDYESGTRIGFWVSESNAHGSRIREEAITAAISAIPIIGYNVWQGSDPLSFLFIPAIYLARRWRTEYKLAWPEYPATPA